MHDLVMDGEITAESDISVSPPDHAVKEGPATVMTLPEKGVWRDGNFITTVYIPGSSIRGALRNGAARAIAAARAERQSPMTPDEFLLIAKGGIKDRKEAGTDERVVDFQAISRLRREQPIISLFGAMAEKIVGRWQIGDAVPVEPVTPSRKGRGVRSHPFQRQPDLANFMDEAAYRSFLETDRRRVEANLAEDEAQGLVKRIVAEKRRPEPDMQKMEEWQADADRLKGHVDKLRAEAGGAVNIQQLLGGWQSIPEGTRLSHRMRIRDVSEDELATAFFALRRLAREGRIGAHESRGEGYFSARYDLRLAIDKDGFERVGTLRIEDFDLDIQTGNAALAAAFQRSENVLNSIASECA